jgi:predicted nucleic acid-binding protein
VSSALLRIELVRAVSRRLPALLPEAHELLMAIDYVSIGDRIVDAAANQPERDLRSLDAIHLATAQALEPDVTAMVTYDDRLALAARNAGMSVTSPHD